MDGNWGRLHPHLAGNSQVINLTGPLGVGKSWLLQRVRTEFPEISVLDNVDNPAARIAAVAASQNGRIVLASRRRLPWANDTVTMQPWPLTELAALAQGSELAARLAGGLPLVAVMVRQLEQDGIHDPAAAAAALSAEILSRLEREGAGPLCHEAITALAAVGAADEEMLRSLIPLPGTTFDTLASLSIVQRDALGLTMLEPYRTLLDLRLDWHHPLHRRSVLVKGLSHRAKQIELLPGHARYSKLFERTLMLLDDPVVRDTLFPAAPASIAIRPAVSAEFDLMQQMSRKWAERGELSPESALRMTARWWEAGAPAFKFAVNLDGDVLGMYYQAPLAERATVAEPLLQQHFPDLAESGTGQLLGLAYSPDDAPGVHAAILRDALTSGVEAGELMVSTPWLPYQQLCLKVGLAPLGHTRHDVFHCGRPNGVFSRRFTADGGVLWLDAVRQALFGGAGGSPRWDLHVRQALRDLSRPARLSASPLLTLPGIGSLERLDVFLRRAIQVLAAAKHPPDAEAGQLLAAHYLDRLAHETVMRQANLSRATYYRRLSYGVTRITEMLQMMHAAK